MGRNRIGMAAAHGARDENAASCRYRRGTPEYAADDADARRGEVVGALAGPAFLARHGRALVCKCRRLAARRSLKWTYSFVWDFYDAPVAWSRVHEVEDRQKDVFTAT